MVEKYGKQHTIVTFQVGDLAMLRIPKEDLAPTDNRRIACLIFDIPYHNRHQLRTKYGIIVHLYPTDQLNVIPQELQQEIREEILHGPKDELALHTIALFASTADRVGVSCNCKKHCTKTCKCQKNNVLCSIYCHAEEDLDCGNLSGLKERTEQALINKGKERIINQLETFIDITTSESTSLSLHKRARALTTAMSGIAVVTTSDEQPVKKKSQEIKRTFCQTRAQRQATLSQYQEMQPVVNRLASLRTKENPEEISSSSSLSELEDSE